MKIYEDMDGDRYEELGVDEDGDTILRRIKNKRITIVERSEMGKHSSALYEAVFAACRCNNIPFLRISNSLELSYETCEELLIDSESVIDTQISILSEILGMSEKELERLRKQGKRLIFKEVKK